MLVLSCTNHQSVIIDDLVKVTILYNKQGQVVLGIDAPDGAEIRREEACALNRETQRSKSGQNKAVATNQ